MSAASGRVSETRYHVSLSSAIMGHDPLILRHSSPGDGGIKHDFTTSGETSDSDGPYVPESPVREAQGKDIAIFSGDDNPDAIDTSDDSDDSAIACQNRRHSITCKKNSPQNINQCLESSANKVSCSEPVTQPGVSADINTITQSTKSKGLKNTCCKSRKLRISDCDFADEPATEPDSKDTSIETSSCSERSVDTDSSANSVENSSEAQEEVDNKATSNAGSTRQIQITESVSY